MAIGHYVAQRAGIGINAGRIRGINAKIRGGEVQHTGVIPFLKSLNQLSDAALKMASEVDQLLSTFQSGTKKSKTSLFLKNNKGTEDNRVRKLDYSIQFSKLFYERFISNGSSPSSHPHDVPGLYDAFGTDSFDESLCGL